MSSLDKRRFLLLISALVIALNFVRCPELFLNPRFFAEEGTTYFSHAFHNSFLGNIFSAHYGYYTLYNQIATSLASLVPLEYAPLVTTFMSLLVQVGISMYVLWGELPLFDTLWRRSVLALAIPLISWPGHWLTIIGTQSWFGAGTFLLLMAPTSGKQLSGLAFRAGYLFLAGLTGVLSCFMLPAYLWRAVRTKSGELFGYAALLFFCLLVHVGVLIEALHSRSPELSTRFVFNSFETVLGKTVVYQFAVPFTGRGFFEMQFLVDIGAEVKKAVENFFGIHLFIFDQFIIPVIVGLVIIMLTAVIVWLNRSKIEVQVIAVAFISVSTLSNFCSVNSAGGPRYYFIPSLMLLTLFMCINEMKRCKPVIAATALLVVTTLMGNGYEYRSIMYRQAYSPDYPDWRAELELWRMIPSYQINIWPKSWKMNLDKGVNDSET